jgi:pilus assembly protein CpaF
MTEDHPQDVRPLTKVVQLSPEVRPKRLYPGAVAPAADREAEVLLRAQLAAELADLLGQRNAGETSGISPADLGRAEELIKRRVTEYQVRQTSLNLAGLNDPVGARQRLRAGLLGLGPLQPIFEDDAVEEILVNRYSLVYVVVDGIFYEAQGVRFGSEDELKQFAIRLVQRAGGQLDEAHPLADVSLPDGSRLHAAIPPVAALGTTLALRKFVLRNRSLEELVHPLGVLTEEVAAFLTACVRAGLNLLISGRTGSGKSTLLNALGAVLRVRPQERFLLIEDQRELDLPVTVPDLILYQTRDRNADGVGEITASELVRRGLRTRPTRIVIGEVRSAVAFHMLDAMDSGHPGLCTLHAMNPVAALERLVDLSIRSQDVRLSPSDARRLIQRTISLVVHMGYDETGRRQVVSVYELGPLTQSGEFSGHVLWELGTDGRLVRRNSPTCLAELEHAGTGYRLPWQERAS